MEWDKILAAAAAARPLLHIVVRALGRSLCVSEPYCDLVHLYIDASVADCDEWRVMWFTVAVVL